MIYQPLVNRRAIVEASLLENPRWTLRRQAEVTGMSRHMVTRIRDRLIQDGRLIVPAKVEGLDGKAYPVKSRAYHPISLRRRWRQLYRITRCLDAELWRRSDVTSRTLFAEAVERLARRVTDLREGQG